MKKISTFNTKKLNETFNINSPPQILYEEYEGVSGCEGELNPFYGKKHSEETKEKLRQITLELCKDEEFRMSRVNYKEKNGMYGSARFGELNPMWGKTHSEEAKLKQSEKRKEWFKKNESPLKGKPCLESTKKALSEKNSKEYKLISPEGKIIKIKNLTKFATDNNLNVGCLQHVIAGRNKSHKGWKNAS
jgi:hypothetical protein